jgi:isopentenyl phosphate kinase
MYLVKLGGSVLTNKETFENQKGKKIFYRTRTARLLSELGPIGEEFILVHGAGSFGHPLAKKYKLKDGYKKESQIPIVAKVHEDVRALNLNIIRAMGERGISAASLPPSSLVEFSKGNLKKVNTRPFRHHLEMGVVPVTFGDVVPDTSRKFGICSGDDLMMHLAKEFKPRIAIFVTKVDGIYTGDPKTGPSEFIPEINENTIRLIQDSNDDVPDVTGRMKRKAKMMLTIAEGGVDCVVLNGLKKNRLKKAIKGENVKLTLARGKK